LPTHRHRGHGEKKSPLTGREKNPARGEKEGPLFPSSPRIIGGGKIVEKRKESFERPLLARLGREEKKKKWRKGDVYYHF